MQFRLLFRFFRLFRLFRFFLVFSLMLIVEKKIFQRNQI